MGTMIILYTNTRGFTESACFWPDWVSPTHLPRALHHFRRQGAQLLQGRLVLRHLQPEHRHVFGLAANQPWHPRCEWENMWLMVNI